MSIAGVLEVWNNVTVDGLLTLQGGGTLRIVAQGIGAGQYGSIASTVAPFLDGDLSFLPPEDYDPQLAVVFQILSFPLTEGDYGSFSNISDGVSYSTTFVSYLPN